MLYKLEDNVNYEEIIKEFNNIPLRDFYNDRLSEYNSYRYPLIGSGTTRLVYDIGDDLVLKVADTFAGCAANINEFIVYTFYPKLRPILCPVHWINSFNEEKSRFLVMSNAYKIKEKVELKYDEEVYIKVLSNLGLCEKEFNLSHNWGGFRLLDYGCTLDYSALDINFYMNHLKSLLDL